MIQDKEGVDERASDAELIALVRRAQEEIEAHGELKQQLADYVGVLNSIIRTNSTLSSRRCFSNSLAKSRKRR